MHAAAVLLSRFTVAHCGKCRRTYVIAPGSAPHRCKRPARRQPAAPAGA
jgi:hypothetical protein